MRGISDTTAIKSLVKRRVKIRCYPESVDPGAVTRNGYMSGHRAIQRIQDSNGLTTVAMEI